MDKDLKDVIERGRELGFGEPVLHKAGHYRIVHENGESYVFPASPSDWRWKLNALSDMQKIAGQRLEGKPAGHYKHVRQSVLNTKWSSSEKRAIDKAKCLQEAWDEVIAALQSIHNLYDSEGRNDADDQLGWVLWEKLEEIEADLQALNRVPHTAVPWPRPGSYDEYVELWLGRWPEPVSEAFVALGIERKDPPPRRSGRPNGSHWPTVIDELKKYPGEWFVVKRDVSTSLQQYLKRRYPGVETRSSGIKDRRVAELYARWVGENTDG